MADRRLLEALVGPDSDGMRLDAYLAALDGAPSRSACAKLVEQGSVTINSTLATSKSEKVLLGDRIQAVLPDVPEAGGLLAPNHNIPLDIRFEDDHLIVLSKQIGLVCHPSPGHIDDTLANALVAHCGYAHLGKLQGEDRPGIVHRLDMDTTGLMLCAKSDEVQGALQDLIRLRVLDRRYITLVHGYVAPDEGTIETGIARRSPRSAPSSASRRDARTRATAFSNATSTRAARIRSACTCVMLRIRSWEIRFTGRAPNGRTWGSPASSSIRGALPSTTP